MDKYAPYSPRRNLTLQIKDPQIAEQFLKLKAKERYLHTLQMKQHNHLNTERCNSLQSMQSLISPPNSLNQIIKLPIIQFKQQQISQQNDPKYHYFLEDLTIIQLFNRRPEWNQQQSHRQYCNFHYNIQNPDFGLQMEEAMVTRRKMINYLEFQKELIIPLNLYTNFVKKLGNKTFYTLPIGFVFNIAGQNDSFISFLQGQRNKFIHNELNDGRNMWIIKMNHTIISNQEDLNQFLLTYNPKQQGNQFLLQKYIEKPFLFNGRKFQLIYTVLVNHLGAIYLDTSFQAQVEKEPFDIDKNNIRPTIELIDCQSMIDFIKNHKNYQQEIEPQIKKTILTSMKCCPVNKKNRKYCYQLFDFQFILDCSLKCWLVAVKNSQPNLNQLDQALNLSLDQVFPTKYFVKNQNWSLLT